MERHFTLNYASDWGIAIQDREIDPPLGESIPASCNVSIGRASRRTVTTSPLPPDPSRTTVCWDGKDAWGRACKGRANVGAVDLVYPAFLYPTFAEFAYAWDSTVGNLDWWMYDQFQGPGYTLMSQEFLTTIGGYSTHGEGEVFADPRPGWLDAGCAPCL